MGRSTDSQNMHSAFNGGRISDIRLVNPYGKNICTDRTERYRLRPFTEEGLLELPFARDPLVRFRRCADAWRQQV